MILSNVAIYEALDLKRIVITPEPSPLYLEVGQDSPFDTHSVDLRLGRYLSVPGTITLEIINLGPVPFVLRENMPIGQLIFEEVDGLPISKESQFHQQTRPEGQCG